jgi:AcrR family transcriptional regulator
MEAVADEVGMSKVTVYGYFKDKHDLFEAVASGVADRLRAAVDAELVKDGTPAALMTAALAAKHFAVWDLVRNSAFASELFAAKSEFASNTFMALDETIEAALAKTLKRHKISRPRARARILFGAANGIANRASSKSVLKRDLALLVSHLVRED